jgi:hypothetical protein
MPRELKAPTTDDYERWLRVAEYAVSRSGNPNGTGNDSAERRQVVDELRERYHLSIMRDAEGATSV